MSPQASLISCTTLLAERSRKPSSGPTVLARGILLRPAEEVRRTLMLRPQGLPLRSERTWTLPIPCRVGLPAAMPRNPGSKLQGCERSYA